jgi:archaellin
MFIPGITQSQLQMTKHDMNSPVLQHQLTTITASKMMSTEHQTRQEGTTAVYIEGQIIKIWSQETGQTTIYKTLDRNQGSRNMNHTNTCVK